MITFKELPAVLEKSGLPVTYRAWPEKQAPPLPYICYLSEESDNFAADGTVYQKIISARVELYTRRKNLDAEEAVENALSAASLVWSKDETYISSEHCYLISYETEVFGDA